MTDQLKTDLVDLMMIAGLSGHEDRVRRAVSKRLTTLGIASTSDRMGNLVASFEGDRDSPTVMIFAHMDQLGFFVRKIEEEGLIRVERVGGVPERALASQHVTLCADEGDDLDGIITNKSHHATSADDKYRVVPASSVYIDAGFGSKSEAEAAGIRIGTPVVYKPKAVEMPKDRIAGTSVDDRAGCAVLLDLARKLAGRTSGTTVHLVFSVQEEFNLRGAMSAAHILKPDIAIQLDIMLATDTPDMDDRGEMRLGGGPGMSLYSFHGRGTLNGVIPHPKMVRLCEDAANSEGITLQRSAQTGVLTDLSYIQQLGQGVASVDLGFPCRYTHSSMEMCAVSDLHDLSTLLESALKRIKPGFSLTRD